MKPLLWVGLLIAGAMSLYVAQQPDGDVDLASRTKAGSGPVRQAGVGHPADLRRATRTTQLQPLKDDAQLAAWAQLLAALEGWQQRRQSSQPWPALSGPAPLAWAAQAPPPPPVEAAPPAPPPPPMAPPFPHAWVGRYVDNAVRAVVAGPAQTWVVQAKDVLDGQWRVDAIEERQMRLTYLPLQQSQTVNLK